jgi:hypothetical protein
MFEITTHWDPDVTATPDDGKVYQSLCLFNYSDSEEKALAFVYQRAEVPFITYGIPEADLLDEKWTPDYLSRMVKSTETMESEDNHQMYWTRKRSPKGTQEGAWKQPTTKRSMGFVEWYEKAGSKAKTEQNERHHYLKTSSGKDKWIKQDVPFLDAKTSLFIPEPKGHRSIHCRFGQEGIIAEAHWDVGRNSIVQIHGNKRWLLLPTAQCANI